MNGGTTHMSCPTCGCSLTLVIDFERRQTYWQCQVCNPKRPEHNDGLDGAGTMEP
jgi:hypothetical protein